MQSRTLVPNRFVGLILRFVLSWRSVAVPTVTSANVDRRLRLTADEISSSSSKSPMLEKSLSGENSDPSSVCLLVNLSTFKRAFSSPRRSFNCFLSSRPSRVLELFTNSMMQPRIDTAEPSAKRTEPLRLSVVSSCNAW